MYIELRQIAKSLQRLEAVHTFYGITYLVCKLAKLPIGFTANFAVNVKETEFLRKYYHPDPNSNYFYRVFRPSDKNKHWVPSDKYASSTLQSIRTQSAFADAFIHSKGTDIWGWRSDYIDILRSNLSSNMPPYRNRKIPTADLAIWLYRDVDFGHELTSLDIARRFFSDFSISEEEQTFLFDILNDTDLNFKIQLQPKPVTWDDLEDILGRPPDVGPAEGGSLFFLETQGIGPAHNIKIEPSTRLNVITGDNGLGKTFILDCAWWVLTNQWVSQPPTPQSDANKDNIQINFGIARQSSNATRLRKQIVKYDWERQTWPNRKRTTVPGLLFYALVDGSYAIWDPVRDLGDNEESHRPFEPRALELTQKQAWQGVTPRINGLLWDWILWQNNPSRYSQFETFKKVLDRLSPPRKSDLGKLVPDEPVRLPNDSREWPTIHHCYGTIPILYASAAVKRVLTIAYLLVWMWEEHKAQCDLLKRRPEQRIIILIDEIEAHLHPQWQRRILPAVLKVCEDLSRDLQVQLIVSTHSPLVLASAEPIFDYDQDMLFHLNITETSPGNPEVVLETPKFFKYGSIEAWLTSDVFELDQARSIEAEEAIDEARVLQLSNNVTRDQVNAVSQKLLLYLSEIDKFWPRWTYFAEQHGVEL